MSDLRQRARKTEPTSIASPSSKEPTAQVQEPARFTLLDALRILGGLVLVNCVLSYFITGESIIWGYRPWYTRPAALKAYLRGPLYLTDEELAPYNGTDASLPIYVAVNGTIFDVSASPHFYGPGGSYHFFAGRDATRGFVTGCFAEDLTPDVRGIEEMYIPLEHEEEIAEEGRGDVDKSQVPERKKHREVERRAARKKVHDTIQHWEQFFRGTGGKGGKYFEVGKVKREDGWLEKLPRRELCEQAKKSRQRRKQ